jgi:hypothetical protein
MMLKRAEANRAADLKIDQAARDAAKAVRGANNDRATERFLNRFLDSLHDVDNARIGLATRDEAEERAAARRRRRRQAE